MESEVVADDDFISREYQKVLAEQALSENKVLFLPTGSGKTFIAIMVLKRMFHLLEPDYSCGGRRAVFLVNTVALVEQQALVLERHLLLDEVGQYSGDKNVDHWTLSKWKQEFTKFKVMVMTAEILNQLLLKKYISLNNLALLILDECHHAVEDHPMRQIMRLFEDCPKEQQPRVIGLTATLLNSTPKSSLGVVDEVKTLEVSLHSTVATVNSWDLVKQFSTKPKEIVITFKPYCESNYYDPNIRNFIARKIGSAHKMSVEFNFVYENSPGTLRRIDGFMPLISAKKNEVANLMLQILKQFDWLGIYGCSKTLHAVYITLKSLQLKIVDKKSILMISNHICTILSLSNIVEVVMRGTATEHEKAYTYSSLKVQELVKVLKDYHDWCNAQPEELREEMQALIFVREKMTAKILCCVLKNIADKSVKYGFIKSGFIVGGTYNPLTETWEGSFHKHANDKIIERFRKKQINVLVATDVLEEGIDIPNCNVVVRFDLAESFRSYVQSKGRARHDTSLFCLMVETTEKDSYQRSINRFKGIEGELEKLLVGHTDDRISPSEMELEELYASDIKPYCTDLGSKVTMTSAIQLVNGYCMYFAHDRFSIASPTWYRKSDKKGIVVAVKLPKFSPMQDLVMGQPMVNLKIAKRAAAFEICKKLHQVGELNDNLMPNEKSLEESDMIALLPLWEKEGQNNMKHKTGTKQKTRVYPMHEPMCFQQCEPTTRRSVYLLHIEISPAYEKPTDPKKSVIFSVLNEKKNFAIVSSKLIDEVCSFPVFPKFGVMKVNFNSMASVILTEEQLTDITLFHTNLFTSHIPAAKHFMAFSRDSFLLAPTKRDHEGHNVLDWDTMRSFGMAAQCAHDPVKCVVTPRHRGASFLHEAFFVTRVCDELNCHSAFPGGSYSTYKDYYIRHHNFQIKCPSKPLLEVQPFKVISNDLLPRLRKDTVHGSGVVYFPIEACQVKCAEGCLFLKGTMLPSILHRMERLLLANDLCKEINSSIMDGAVHSSFVKDCMQWRQEDKTNPSDVDKFKAHSFVKSEVSSKKDSRAVPWDELEEPVDIEHDFDSVTDEDIYKYRNFFAKKVSAHQSPFSAASRDKTVRWNLPKVERDEGKIKLLKGKKHWPHPCQIFEATTAVSSDDFLNLERLETLGDAFLKFAVSLMLYVRFPTLGEGNLTDVKGQILGNRNLFYCGKAKEIPCFLKVQKVVLSELWCPPSFSVPKQVLNPDLALLIRRVNLSGDDQSNNELETETMNKRSSLATVPQTPSSMDQQVISDKTIADCVEALIGVYLETCGSKGAMLFMEWMQVLPVGSEALIQVAPEQHVQPVSFADAESFKKLEERLGYVFKNKSLLSEALTHGSSPSSSRTYERLEFLGDSLLDFLTTAFIFENCGKLSPGELTDLRSALVNNVTFACLSVRYEFYKFLSASSPALLNAVDQFVRFQESRDHVIDEEVLVLLEERECSIAETVEVPKALGDLFESLVGAIFLDSGRRLDVVWRVVYRLMKQEICTFSKNVPKQVVRQLYEVVGHNNLEFRLSAATKESLMEQVHIILTVRKDGEERSFNGFGTNKKQAKKSAAKLALKQLKRT